MGGAARGAAAGATTGIPGSAGIGALVGHHRGKGGGVPGRETYDSSLYPNVNYHGYQRPSPAAGPAPTNPFNPGGGSAMWNPGASGAMGAMGGAGKPTAPGASGPSTSPTSQSMSRPSAVPRKG